MAGRRNGGGRGRGETVGRIGLDWRVCDDIGIGRGRRRGGGNEVGGSSEERVKVVDELPVREGRREGGEEEEER